LFRHYAAFEAGDAAISRRCRYDSRLRFSPNTPPPPFSLACRQIGRALAFSAAAVSIFSFIAEASRRRCRPPAELTPAFTPFSFRSHFHLSYAADYFRRHASRLPPVSPPGFSDIHAAIYDTLRHFFGHRGFQLQIAFYFPPPPPPPPPLYAITLAG
jgi:hypothetical protein